MPAMPDGKSVTRREPPFWRPIEGAILDSFQDGSLVLYAQCLCYRTPYLLCRSCTVNPPH